MELQLMAQRRAECRDPGAVLIADLQVKDLRGAELHALGRGDFHGLLQAFHVVVGGPGGGPGVIGRRADFHQRRLEHAVALGQLHDRFLNALQVFGPAELARFRLAADGLVAHDQGLRGLPGLGRKQGIGHRGRGDQQRDRAHRRQ